MFSRSRRRLTLYYSCVMGIFLFTLIILMHFMMEWALSSEQERELTETAANLAEAQNSFNMHHEIVFDDNNLYKSSSDRIFFYIFDDEKRLVNFSRASFRIESMILDSIDAWNVPEGDFALFSKLDEKGGATRVMMTSHRIYNMLGKNQTVYVGKDVTAVYSGMQKATYALIILGLVALLIATVVGYFMAGRAIVPLKAAYERQRQFAADASHELRTPLAVVMASADLLRSDPSIKSPFLRQVIDDVADEVKKMTKLVGELLLVARSDNKALTLKLTNFDMAALLAQAARLFEPLAEKKKISIITEKWEKTELEADEQKIRQLVTILIDNAVKYTPEGGKVLLTLKRKNNHVSFSVKDTGVGISKDDQERIFDRFYRVDKTRSRAMGGSGLGLSIALEIVNLHQGKISLQSEPGKGSKFTVDLKNKEKRDEEIYKWLRNEKRSAEE